MTDSKVRYAPHPNPLLGEERGKRRLLREERGKEFSSPLNGRG